MTGAQWAEMDTAAAEGYAYQAFLMDGKPKMLAPEILDWEIRDEDWEWMRLDNEPGYDESLCPYRY